MDIILIVFFIIKAYIFLQYFLTVVTIIYSEQGDGIIYHKSSLHIILSSIL